MLTTEEFISRYEEYTDEELFPVYDNIDDYSAEARDAFQIVIKKKGGLDQWLDRRQQKQVYAAEVTRIGREAARMGAKNVDVDFVRTIITSEILPPGKVDETITEAFRQVAVDKEDRKITPRTIIGGLLAVAVAGSIGGVGWGLKEIYAPDIFEKIQFVLLVGLGLMCYAIVKKFTRQSQKNVVVFFATALSIILSILLGVLIADLAGVTHR